MCGFLCTDTCQPKYLFQYVSLSYNYYYKTNRINKVNKNLPTIKQSTEVALSRANTLMDVADKILAKQSTDLVDESWMERLWQWADDNGVYPGFNEFRIKGRSLLNLYRLHISRFAVYRDKGSDISTLCTLPKEIGNLTNLYVLQISGCPLTVLPKEIGNLTNLYVLQISESRLTELPKEIGNLLNLTNLSLEINHLTELPKEIGNLLNLTNLSLVTNQLTELPKEIGNLVNLTNLSLEINQLTELPKEITNLVNLTELSFNVNQLSLTKEQQEWFDNIESTELY